MVDRAPQCIRLNLIPFFFVVFTTKKTQLLSEIRLKCSATKKLSQYGVFSVVFPNAKLLEMLSIDRIQNHSSKGLHMGLVQGRMRAKEFDSWGKK